MFVGLPEINIFFWLIYWTNLIWKQIFERKTRTLKCHSEENWALTAFSQMCNLLMNKLIWQTSFLFFPYLAFLPMSRHFFFFFLSLNLRHVKGCPNCLCRCFRNFFQQTWFPEENGIMKRFSLSTALGHGGCQNQWFTLFPLPLKAISSQGSVRFRRSQTACCSRLSRPQAGSALVVPESALTFILAILLPSIQVLPSSPACCLLKEKYPISFPMNLQKNEMNLFFLNESSEEEGSFSCLCEAAQFSKDPGR